jgi:hypothetical protein
MPAATRHTIDAMKTTTMLIGIDLATVLFLSAGLSGAEPARLMRVLIKPGAMSEMVGKGDVDIEMTVPDVEVPAGAPLLSLSTMVPGATPYNKKCAGVLPVEQSLFP